MTTYHGRVVRSDGQWVNFVEDTTKTDPDERIRFEAFPASCGCYPGNTDGRRFVCPHGARWTRDIAEPYGSPSVDPGKPRPRIVRLLNALARKIDDQTEKLLERRPRR